MADPANYPSQPPWKYSATIGGYYVYNPKTEAITLSDGRCFLRPQNIQVAALMNAAWDRPLSPPNTSAQNNNGGHRPLAGWQGGQNTGSQVRGGAQVPTAMGDAEFTTYLNGRFPTTYQQPCLQSPAQQGPVPQRPAQQRFAQPGYPSSPPIQQFYKPNIQDIARRTGDLSIGPSTRQAQGHATESGTPTETVVQRGPPDQMTPLDLRRQGIAVRRHVMGTGDASEGSASTLDPSYFVVGHRSI